MTNNNSAEGFATISVAAVLAESARRTPDNIALVVGGDEVSYGDLWRQTRAYAGALRARGIGPGDAVAVLIPNVPDFARVYYAILSLGAIVVPVHALLKAREIEYVLQDSGTRLLVCAAALLPEGAAGAEAASVDVLTVMASDDDGGFPRLEAEAASAAPIRPPSSTPRAPPANRRVHSAPTSPWWSRRRCC